MNKGAKNTKILLVAATAMEVKLLTEECEYIHAESDNLKTYRYKNLFFDLLLSGIGSPFTTFSLTHTLLNYSYSMVINAGIAGSLSEQLKIGDVVSVVEDEFADLGIEEENGFLTLFDSGFLQPDEFPFENRTLKADGVKIAGFLPRVKGITTNVSHGRDTSVDKIKNQFSASVESMEGAAVFYVCLYLGLPCIQIRAVSNRVAPREHADWDIPLALENLKNILEKVLSELPVQVE
jgi:futalosine hydrolase